MEAEYEPLELAALEIIAELESAIAALKTVHVALADEPSGGGVSRPGSLGQGRTAHIPGGGNAPDWGDYWLLWERANRKRNNHPGTPTSVPPWFTITDPGAQIVFTDLGGPGWTIIQGGG